ncbi:MAG: YggT family protein [Acidimicrobiia bacterium]
MGGLGSVLCPIVELYTLAIILRVVLSWFPATSGGFVGQASYLLGRITEPVMEPVRRMMPSLGPLDLSPVVVLLFLQIVVQGLILGC